MTASTKRFGPFELFGKAATGGMAEVYYARDPRRPAELLALKKILTEYQDDPLVQSYFESESELARMLDHPAVVKFVAAGQIEGARFLALEYIRGCSLNVLLERLSLESRRLPIPHALFIAIRALEGLDYVHNVRDGFGNELQIVVCDLSTSNIMISYTGQVKLIDFGIANSRLKPIGNIGTTKGKKRYMAPEQLQGLPLDKRADVFSMGMCLYELLTGKSPFAGANEFEVAEAIRTGAWTFLNTPLPSVPPEVQDALGRALTHRREDRFPSAAVFAEALRPFAKTGKGQPIGEVQLCNVLSVLLKRSIAEDERSLVNAIDGTHTIPQSMSDLDPTPTDILPAGLREKR